MPSCARAISLLLVAALVCQSLAAEDVKLREQAVHLMEVANALSLPGALRNYQQTVTFRVHEPDGSVQEGSFSRQSAGADGHRDEFTFGNYHKVIVIAGDRISQTHAPPMPPEVRELRKYIPIHIGLFDKDDVIRSIESSNILGRPAKCINFDTHFGTTMQANQLCVDSEHGYLVRWQLGDEVIENSDFFQIANLWEPAQIRRFVLGALQLEVEQHMAVIEGPMDSNVFSPPSQHWDKMYDCTTKRRPIGVATPMPPPGKSGTDIVDVIVHGWVLANGTVSRLQIESSPRPDLNDEALKTVSGWTFLPLMCNDQPASLEGDFVVHFQGR
jgi:TonB family protein